VWRQPRAVWAVAFACVVAFMGLGLVDPILPAIARQLDATPSQVELVFTSYCLVTGVAMLVTGVVSSRVGHKRTLLAGAVPGRRRAHVHRLRRHTRPAAAHPTGRAQELNPGAHPASAAYSFIRFVGGAAAPFLAGKLAESFVPSIPFYVGAAAVFVSIAILFSGRAYLSKV
jgi:fucose permease